MKLITILENELERLKEERDEAKGVKAKLYFLGKIQATTKIIKLIQKGYS